MGRNSIERLVLLVSQSAFKAKEQISLNRFALKFTLLFPKYL